MMLIYSCVSCIVLPSLPRGLGSCTRDSFLDLIKAKFDDVDVFLLFLYRVALLLLVFVLVLLRGCVTQGYLKHCPHTCLYCIWLSHTWLSVKRLCRTWLFPAWLSHIWFSCTCLGHSSLSHMSFSFAHMTLTHKSRSY